MKLPLYQVDAGTDRLFAGNPAAVVLVTGDVYEDVSSLLTDQTMQAIAAENNLSETAFVLPALRNPATGNPADFHIRWFTPTVEVDLCGHATLAAAHVLFHHAGHAGDTVTLDSRSGRLAVRLGSPSHPKLLRLDFPSDPPRSLAPNGPDATTSAAVARALGREPVQILRGRDDILAVFDHQSRVRELQPDMAQLSQITARGVIASAPGAPRGDMVGDFAGRAEHPDFVSRFFAPRVGVPEDPLTGSAHTVLTPYWSERLGKDTLIAHQVSARGGRLLCRLFGDRVDLGGHAVTFFAGTLFLAST